MNRKYGISILSLLILTQFAFSQISQDRLHYINKYKQIAQEEMERTGVPASIKLAQAILESNGGKSVLSRKANNHFGIKCGGDWNNRSFYRVDDEKDSKGNDIESCFRVYKNPESSFIAHSEFLRSNQRYEFLFTLDHKDYQGWAYGLKKAGYATNPKYPTLLINIIDNYELYLYDDLFEPGDAPMLASADEDEAIMIGLAEEKRKKEMSMVYQVTKLNDIDVVHSKKGDTPETISMATDIPMRRIFRYNESLTNAGQAIPENTVVFLQPKRKAFRGKKKFHRVMDGESIAQVSQKYGIQIDQILRRNRLEVNEEPLEGAILKIRGKRVPKNMRIPTREVYALENSKKNKEAKEKYATALSDFEAPPTTFKKESTDKKENNNSIFNFGKKKNTNYSARRPSAPKDSYKASPAYEEEVIVEAEPSYSAPSSSENYNSESSSVNAIFKEQENTVSGNSTSPSTIVSEPSSNASTSVYSQSTDSAPITSTSSSTIITPPTQVYTPEEKSTVITSTSAIETRYHTVIKGETLYRLSKMYDKSVDYIKQVNGLSSNTISIGQKLIVN